MCGRFALFASEADILKHFRLTQGFCMKPRYNIAPAQTIPIVVELNGAIAFARWGYLASWVKQTEASVPLGHINARLESLHEKVSFKMAFQKQRCLVPASGYFEWCLLMGRKQPYYIFQKKQPLFAFAGIYSIWQGQNGIELITVALITQSAPPFLQKIHQRVPVFINPENYAAWLSKQNKNFDHEVGVWEEENTGFFAVSPKMSNPKMDSIIAIQPLSHTNQF